MYCLNGLLNRSSTSQLLRNLLLSCLLLAVTTATHAATECRDNNGSGYPIPDYDNMDKVIGILNLSLPFNFGDISVLHDLNVEVDIVHNFPGDLTLKMTSPESGEQITLFERPGTPRIEGESGSPFGCNEPSINATFDDEAANPIENEACVTPPPALSGNFKPHNPDPAPNDLSTYNNENPNGNWSIYISDSGPGDPGVLNEICLTAEFAGVTFDKWVSTNATCSDTLDDLTVSAGTPVYYCYTVSNPSTELFTINPGDTSDDQGLDISGLEGTYAAGSSNTVIVPLIAGTDTSLGETINIAEITATFATLNFMGPLTTNETARLNVPPPVIEISKTVNVIPHDSDEVNTTNPKAIPGAVVEYTISVTNSGLGSTDNDTIVINDPIPENTRLFLTNPITFSDGTTPSGLSFNFATLASTTDDIAFSNDGGVSTVPLVTLDADGFDATTPPINHISINPKGSFRGRINATDTPSFEIKFSVRIE